MRIAAIVFAIRLMEHDAKLYFCIYVEQTFYLQAHGHAQQ